VSPEKGKTVILILGFRGKSPIIFVVENHRVFPVFVSDVSGVFLRVRIDSPLVASVVMFAVSTRTQISMNCGLKSGEYRRDYRAFLASLRKAREDAGLTQVEVARKLSRPQSFVSKVESGERKVDFVELQYLAKLYRKPISFFTIAESR
jgi:hypothetical protein